MAFPVNPVDDPSCQINWEFIQSLVFAPGDIKSTLAATAPAGWLMLSGQTVNSSEYPNLAKALGVTGATITLPDARGRSLIAAGTGAGLTARTLGDTGGEETHLLTSGESGVPAHQHGTAGIQSNTVGGAGAIIGPTHTLPNTTSPNTNSTYNSVNNNTPVNASTAHNNMQPWVAVNYMVKT